MTDNIPLSAKDRDPASLLQTLSQLQREAASDTLDIERVQPITEALLEHYEQSADAARFDNPLEGPNMLAQFAALHCGVTVATLDSRDLEETLFDVIPAKVSVGSEIAKNIVETCRAFYVWLKREYDLEQADDIIVLLNDDATRELEEQMDDPTNYGPAKAMIMQALAQGVDLSSKEAVNAFMSSQIQSGAASDFGSMYDYPFDQYGGRAPVPQTHEQKRANQKKRKKNRKAARKARKKSR